MTAEQASIAEVCERLDILEADNAILTRQIRALKAENDALRAQLTHNREGA